MLGSNFGSDTGYADLLFHGFSQSLHPDSFLPNPFQFINHFTIRRYAV
jgi:hypothetical protein